MAGAGGGSGGRAVADVGEQLPLAGRSGSGQLRPLDTRPGAQGLHRRPR